ncbi:hypothetical protein F5148DRAFT_1195721 [Russula earlei]|uniref:Uncharacterized protein n=1 Tax=Russula earlei TaxID=71964 RepID=A0ACC0UA47_9AGAM|nr:hypothetical protein F5148DRAFT_1195721 [Russula earlei]
MFWGWGSRGVSRWVALLCPSLGSLFHYLLAGTFPKFSLAKWPHLGCAGHRSMSEADTVKTQARKVRPKSEVESKCVRPVACAARPLNGPCATSFCFFDLEIGDEAAC